MANRPPFNLARLIAFLKTCTVVMNFMTATLRLITAVVVLAAAVGPLPPLA